MFLGGDYRLRFLPSVLMIYLWFATKLRIDKRGRVYIAFFPVPNHLKVDDYDSSVCVTYCITRNRFLLARQKILFYRIPQYSIANLYAIY